MRIIGGTLKRKKLSPLRGVRIRPTTDFLREAIFNILADTVEGAAVLDLFAGTGSFGIEAISRGARSAVFVDNQSRAIKILVDNISVCDLQERCTVVKRDILQGLSFLQGMVHTFDLVFVDPPYDRGYVERTLHLLDRSQCTAPEACLVIEHSLRETLPQKVGTFERASDRQHGKSLVSFYRAVL